VFRGTLPYLPRLLEWARANVRKVRQLTLVAHRAAPPAAEPERLAVTSERMYEELQEHDRRFVAAAYLPGAAAPHTTKFLIAVQLASRSRLLGYLGPRAIEAAQTAHHFFKGRYVDFTRRSPSTRTTLLLGIVDPAVRDALKGLARAALRRPLGLFEGLCTQTILLQQPLELVDGVVNPCGGCPEMTVWQGGLVPSCRLDEYRSSGGPMVPVRSAEQHPALGRV